jgi:hypothetical protein
MVEQFELSQSLQKHMEQVVLCDGDVVCQIDRVAVQLCLMLARSLLRAAIVSVT